MERHFFPLKSCPELPSGSSPPPARELHQVSGWPQQKISTFNCSLCSPDKPPASALSSIPSLPYSSLFPAKRHKTIGVSLFPACAVTEVWHSQKTPPVPVLMGSISMVRLLSLGWLGRLQPCFMAPLCTLWRCFFSPQFLQLGDVLDQRILFNPCPHPYQQCSSPKFLYLL